jgi:hypothetical protein
VETEKKNRWVATVKKPEVTEDFNKCIHAIDSAHQILHYHPCCRKTVKWSKKFLFFLLLMAALNSFVLLKKYTTNQNHNGKDNALNDLTLDCAEKRTES